MPKPSLKATVTATVTTTIKIKPTVTRMLVERCAEAVRLNKQAKEIAARKKRIGAEVEELLQKEKQTGALLDGFELDGYQMKLIAGVTKKLDKKRMLADGIDISEYEEEVPKAAYVRIAKKGEKEEAEDED